MLRYRDAVRRFSLLGVTLAALVIMVPGAALAQQTTGTTPTPPDAPAPTPVDTTPTTPAPPAIPVPVAPVSPVTAPTRTASWSALLLLTTTGRAQPSPGGTPLKLVQPVAPLGAGPVWLHVRDVKVVGPVRWVKVLLPVRPNGTVVWMRASAFVFRKINFRVDIDLSARTLSLFRKGTRVKRFTVAIGAPITPTPTGRMAIAEVIHTGDPNAFLGATVMPLTGFSNTLNEYAGGNGRLAIHGTNLPDLIGKAVSKGCIRMNNEDIRVLSRMIGSGTPVVIRQ